MKLSKKGKEAQELINRWMREQFGARRMKAQDRRDYGLSLLGKYRGLTSNDVTWLHREITDFAASYVKPQKIKAA